MAAILAIAAFEPCAISHEWKRIFVAQPFFTLD
jgi:hypothetical protein